jgi:hypothetical protein
VTNMTNGEAVTASDCGMHVILLAFAEPPNVNPVLWVPHDGDPAPLVPQAQRVWRAICAAYVDQQGKTFRMNPPTTIVSSDTKLDSGAGLGGRGVSRFLRMGHPARRGWRLGARLGGQCVYPAHPPDIHEGIAGLMAKRRDCQMTAHFGPVFAVKASSISFYTGVRR